jgi:hypothetical protein
MIPPILTITFTIFHPICGICGKKSPIPADRSFPCTRISSTKKPPSGFGPDLATCQGKFVVFSDQTLDLDGF